MIKLYFKIENNMLTTNLLFIVIFIVLISNAIVRIFPRVFLSIPTNQGYYSEETKIIPNFIFTYCDVYLLVLFIILIFFFLGTDFTNSMEDIALVIGGSKTNKFMLRKLEVLLLVYFALYILSYVNIYNLYMTLLPKNFFLIPLKDIIFCSLTTNIFILSLSVFLLFLIKDIAVTTSIITAYYLIEEALWRCKIMSKQGILGHIYQYYDYTKGEMYSIKIIYLIMSIILLFYTYKISKRKRNIFSKLFYMK